MKLYCDEAYIQELKVPDATITFIDIKKTRYPYTIKIPENIPLTGGWVKKKKNDKFDGCLNSYSKLSKREITTIVLLDGYINDTRYLFVPTIIPDYYYIVSVHCVIII